MVAYGIFVNSKFSHLRMKHNVGHISTCTESECIYALLEITDNFFKHLWPEVSNYTLDFSLELKNCASFVGVQLVFHKLSQEVRSQDVGGHSLSPCKNITRFGNSSWSDAGVSPEAWQVA